MFINEEKEILIQPLEWKYINENKENPFKVAKYRDSDHYLLAAVFDGQEDIKLL